MTVTEFLREHVPFLAGLPEADARELASSAEQLSFGSGQTVLFKGTTIDGLYVVATGKVGVWIRKDKNQPAVLAAELGPGEVFGETSIMEMTTAGATIKASVNDTLLFMIPQDAFRGVLARSEDLRRRAEALIAERKKKTAELLSPALAAA